MSNLASYSKLTTTELEHIVRDAAEAAIAMQGHDPNAERKYLDQINDAITVLARRKAGRMQQRVPRALLLQMLDEATSDLFSAQRSVVGERSSSIRADTLVRLDEVNARRALAGLEPLPVPECYAD